MASPWRFLVFADDWARHPSSSQHLLAGFLGDHPMWWVNSLGMRAPRPSRYDLQRVWERLRHGKKAPAQGVSGGAVPRLIQPRFLPFHAYAPARAINRRCLGRQVRAHLAAASLGAADGPLIIWISNPYAAYLREEFPHALLVYYCGDDFTTLPGVNHAAVSAHEEQLLATADLVIFSSPTLVRLKGERVRGQQALLPHGVDVQRFTVPPTAVPPVMRDLPRPVIGFFGIFAEWINVELLRAVAVDNPDYTFCLIGAPDARAQALSTLSNVRLLGKLPHHELPAYAAGFDVGLLLYDTRHEMTQSINPLKMLEYYALGLPVVSTLRPSEVVGSEHLFVGQDPEIFGKAIRLALAASPAQRALLRHLARANSWDVRHQQLTTLLANGLAAKGQRD